MDWKPGTIFTMLRDTGGIKPNERKRDVAHLTLSEREEIRAGLSAKMSVRAIATALKLYWDWLKCLCVDLSFDSEISRA